MSQKGISLFYVFSIGRVIDITGVLFYTKSTPQNIVPLCKLALYFVYFLHLFEAYPACWAIYVSGIFLSCQAAPGIHAPCGA